MPTVTGVPVTAVTVTPAQKRSLTRRGTPAGSKGAGSPGSGGSGAVQYTYHDKQMRPGGGRSGCGGSFEFELPDSESDSESPSR